MAADVSAPGRRRRGRPPLCPPETLQQVVTLHLERLSLARISTVMNARGVPTPAGGPRWSKNRVDGLLRTRHAQEHIASLNASHSLSARSRHSP